MKKINNMKTEIEKLGEIFDEEKEYDEQEKIRRMEEGE